MSWAGVSVGYCSGEGHKQAIYVWCAARNADDTVRGQIHSQGANTVKSTLHAPTLHLKYAHTQRSSHNKQTSEWTALAERKRLCDSETSSHVNVLPVCQQFVCTVRNEKSRSRICVTEQCSWTHHKLTWCHIRYNTTFSFLSRYQDFWATIFKLWAF